MSLPFRVRVKDRQRLSVGNRPVDQQLFYRLMLKRIKFFFGDPNQNFRTNVFRLEFGVICSPEHHTLFESLESVYEEELCHYNEEELILS